jgi:hypothetical protein
MGGFWYIFYGGFIEVFILVDIVGKLTADRPFFLIARWIYRGID